METSQHHSSTTTGADAGTTGAAAMGANEHGQEFLAQYNELTNFDNQNFHENILASIFMFLD